MDNFSYNSSYPGSGGSSPHSREMEFENPPPWDESQSNQYNTNYKVKFICSYGGKIQPRQHDNQLSYTGGETKILAVDRGIKFNSLLSKLIALCDGDTFKYQLPGEDLDALISVTNDDDLEHMMHEYDRLSRASPKPARLRIFVFSSLNSSERSFESDEVKSEKERFVEALNSAPVMTAPPPVAVIAAASNVDLLFGLEKANVMSAVPVAQQQQTMGKVIQEVDDPVIPALDERLIRTDAIEKHIQDLQRMRIEEQQVQDLQRMRIEEQQVQDLQRMRIEEQQGIYQRKGDDNLVGGFTGNEYYRVPEKVSPPTGVPGGIHYWTEKHVPAAGVFPASSVNTEQPVYMIPASGSPYHPSMVRPMAGAPNQGYYPVQRRPSDVYRDQQMYAVIQQTTAPPTLPPQKVTGYPEGFGMVRPTTTGGVGMVTEGGYAQLAYDGGMGRQVFYTTAGNIMGAPPQVQLAQYQAMAAAGSAEMKPGGAFNAEGGGKVVAKGTQPFL